MRISQIFGRMLMYVFIFCTSGLYICPSEAGSDDFDITQLCYEMNSEGREGDIGRATDMGYQVLGPVDIIGFNEFALTLYHPLGNKKIHLENKKVAIFSCDCRRLPAAYLKHRIYKDKSCCAYLGLNKAEVVIIRVRDNKENT